MRVYKVESPMDGPWCVVWNEDVIVAILGEIQSASLATPHPEFVIRLGRLIDLQK